LGGPARQVLLVRKDAPYKRLEDLKGKKIGLTKGSTDEIALEASFAKRGLRWEDFEIKDLKPAEKPVALQLGHVEAIEAWEPIPSIIVVKGIGRRLLNAHGDIPDIVGVVIANNKFLEEHSEEVVLFLRALHEAAQWAQENPDKMVDFLNKELGLDRKVLIEAIPTQWWYIEVFNHTLADWQRSADLLYRLKRVKEPLDIKKMVDFRYLEKAIGKSFPLGIPAIDVLHYPQVRLKE